MTISQIFGLFGTIISSLIVYFPLNSYYKSKNLLFKNDIFNLSKKTINYCFIGAVLSIFSLILLRKLLGGYPDKNPISIDILLLIAAIAIFEEFIYRKVILGLSYDFSKFKPTKKEFIIFGVLSFALIFPKILFKMAVDIWIVVLFVMLFPIIKLIFYIREFKYRTKFYIMAVFILHIFFFTYVHGSLASYTQYSIAIISGFLYLKSKSILPAVIVHFTFNLGLNFI